MRFSDAFKDMDVFLHKNLHSVTCHEIFQIKKDFYNIVQSFSGSTVFDTHKLPIVGGIACPEVDEYNVHVYIPEKGKDAPHNVQLRQQLYGRRPTKNNCDYCIRLQTY